MPEQNSTRREFLQKTAVLAGSCALGCEMHSLAVAKPPQNAADGQGTSFKLNYILGSPMYGKASLAEVLPEAKKIGATHIDIWPLPHANHLEQVHKLGSEQFSKLLAVHDVALGVITRYDLKPTRLDEGLPLLKQLGGRLLISGSGRGKGDSEKERVAAFLEMMKPQVEKAAELDVILGIENHANTLLHTPDSIHWFVELNRSPHLGLAMAPYHLPQEPETIAKLITDVGPNLVFFQGWQYGKGCAKKLPKEQEMLQMPGRGSLDFQPILAALRKINYQGWTEIFMHPVPRGVPIRETVAEVTAEINRARTYLDKCLVDGV